MSTDDSISGGEERAFLDGGAAPQAPATRQATAPLPSTPPTAPRVSRSQALARLRRGDTVHADTSASTTTPHVAAPATTTTSGVVPTRPDSDDSSLEKAKAGALADVTESPAKKPVSEEEDTSSHAAAGAFHGPGMMHLDSQRVQVSTRQPDEGDDTGAAFQDGYPTTMRHSREEDEDGDNDHRGDFSDRGSSDDGEGGKRGGKKDGSKTNSHAPSTVRAGGAGLMPASSRDPTRAHRAEEGRRLGANALPRMLALQRTFEMEAKKIYEFCTTQVVEWPALALEWIPDRAFTDPERDYTLQYIAVGSQVHPTSGTPNTVKVMEVAVPVASTKDVMYGLYGDDDIQGAEEVDPELQEYVDPGKRFANVKGHFHCEQTLTMDAPVLKIRAMPAETNILAVKTTSGFIGVYNTVRDLHEDANGRTVPDALLRGHRRGGFGLSWNTLKPGYIASASDDGYVNYYDISHRLTIDMPAASNSADPDMDGPETQPIERLVGHRDIITDCSWHSSQSHLLASSSMDGDVRIWDIRMSAGSSTIHSAHPAGAMAAQFHPVGAFQLATAGAEGSVHLWDIRRTTEPVGELAYHGRSITGLTWSPSNETVLASYSDDGRVVMWDLAKTSLPLAYSEDEVAPPEVAFVHMGHVGRVTDAAWNASKTEDWLMASADTTNGLHVYRPLRKVVQDYRMFE